MSGYWRNYQYPEWDSPRYCVFCEIIAGRSPAKVVYEDDDVIAIHNQLNWVPVMLLVIPKKHMTQKEMWNDPVMAQIANVAVEMGDSHCPGGYRLLSNFGHQGMQSQTHGHLHVLGGTHLGRYV